MTKKVKFKVGDKVVVKAMAKGSAWHDERKLFYDRVGILTQIFSCEIVYQRMGYHTAEIKYKDVPKYPNKTPFFLGTVKMEKV
jgi:hypothetical protein